MKAADTSASMAIAACTALTVVPRSLTTAEIATFMIEVSITTTNIAIANRMESLVDWGEFSPAFTSVSLAIIYSPSQIFLFIVNLDIQVFYSPVICQHVLVLQRDFGTLHADFANKVARLTHFYPHGNYSKEFRSLNSTSTRVRDQSLLGL